MTKDVGKPMITRMTMRTTKQLQQKPAVSSIRIRKVAASQDRKPFDSNCSTSAKHPRTSYGFAPTQTSRGLMGNLAFHWQKQGPLCPSYVSGNQSRGDSGNIPPPGSKETTCPVPDEMISTPSGKEATQSMD